MINLVSMLHDGQVLVSAAKGIEEKTLCSMTEVICDVLTQNKKGKIVSVAALSGPTHAEEVIKGVPTAIVSACSDIMIAKAVQDVFMSGSMRVYVNTDIRGVELCGALKNIIALASGIVTGLGYGDNTKAALITRGMHEITRLGRKIGCAEATFYGLAGIGDLIVTAKSVHSRNYRAGVLIGQGMEPSVAVKSIGMVVEGINALKPAIRLGEQYDVELPIISAVYRTIFENKPSADAVQELMQRERQAELSKSIADIRFESAILKSGKETKMKRVITYGTFDMLHYGHINLLKRARALGDYLIVVLSTDEFNWEQKKKKCYFSYEQRKALLESIRYVDLVIPEQNWEQKKTDMHEYHIDTFVMGNDWEGKFDFLKDEGVEVVYLPRTPEISTTQIKEDLHNR
jgi:glycerol-3-phosphate cytidylyltransferase